MSDRVPQNKPPRPLLRSNSLRYAPFGAHSGRGGLFCGTKGAIDEYLFTCVVLCGGTSNNDLYRSFNIDIPKSPLWGYWGFLGFWGFSPLENFCCSLDYPGKRPIFV
jgi:hypothetical protein